MKSSKILEHAIDFGTINSQKNFFSFALKSFLYIIPSVIIGNYTDITIKKIKKEKKFGDNILFYILL
jgi:hypothetical protein